MKTQPLGVKIFGPLFIFGGVLGLPASVPILAWPALEPLMRLALQVVQPYASETDKVKFQEYQASLKDMSSTLQVYKSGGGFIEPLLYLAGASCIWLISGVGVLMLKNWARWLTLIAASGWLWFWGYGFLTEHRLERLYGSQWRPYGQSQWDWLIPMGWGALLLWYFLRPSVRTQFVKRREGH